MNKVTFTSIIKKRLRSHLLGPSNIPIKSRTRKKKNRIGCPIRVFLPLFFFSSIIMQYVIQGFIVFILLYSLEYIVNYSYLPKIM
jgi:hypothetical protein